jgi:hypothetical protein
MKPILLTAVAVLAPAACGGPRAAETASSRARCFLPKYRGRFGSGFAFLGPMA